MTNYPMYQHPTRFHRGRVGLARTGSIPLVLAGLLLVLAPLLVLSAVDRPTLGAVTVSSLASTGALYRIRSTYVDGRAAGSAAEEPAWFRGFADARRGTRNA